MFYIYKWGDAEISFPVVIVGGLDRFSPNKARQDAKYIDTFTNCKVENLPEALHGAAAVDRIICGGILHSELLATYPQSTCIMLNEWGHWINISSMLEARADFTLSKINKDIIAIGGFSRPITNGTLGYRAIYSVESLSLNADNGWRFRKNSPTYLLRHCTIQLNSSHLMVIGGSQGNEVNLIKNNQYKSMVLKYVF